LGLPGLGFVVARVRLFWVKAWVSPVNDFSRVILARDKALGYELKLGGKSESIDESLNRGKFSQN
jgi:hypothetical protein